eukprot:CAMPEP_0197865666 /NCGR_PEP_ID=MMETSP1438-20131217/43793_1 /TAXON_ID=1461541 /ORGANISM="Pterosperma sp., Strain CCMP1384" /LENGTH=71 /DNA_ID=CAMNT_0043484159 /DNA_START=648 /DNA_END=860 /DNA_ORIENTATION=+
MRNHWESYYTSDMIISLASRGVTHVRIPLGYWISEAPVRYPPCTASDPSQDNVGSATGHTDLAATGHADLA